MKYRIRKAVPAEETRIRELFLEMLRTIYSSEDVEGYQDGDLDRFWIDEDNQIYVAEDREVIAFLSIEVHHDQDDYIYLDDFSVTEAYRNQDVGSALIRTAESFAGEINISRICLHVEKTNLDALRFYENKGYLVYRDDGHRFLMKKDLI